MENNDINNNKEEERKNKLLEARRRAARAFHERNKDNEVYKQKQRETLIEFIITTKKEL